MKDRGSTLLEIVVGMLILSIAVSGSFALLVTSQHFLQYTRAELKAVNHASEVLEQLNKYVSANPNLPVNASTALSVGVHSPDIIGLPPTPQDFNCLWSYTVEKKTFWKKISADIKW